MGHKLSEVEWEHLLDMERLHARREYLMEVITIIEAEAEKESVTSYGKGKRVFAKKLIDILESKGVK